MKHNLKWKTLVCASVMMGMSMMMTPINSVCAEEPVTSEEGNVDSPDAETWTAKKEWAYKVIDGHLYKRLYNYSTGRWETDWILVQ